MERGANKLAGFSAAHFLVDFACAFCIFSSLYGAADWVTYLLIYNACAFALQLPIGIIADRYGNNCIFASLGALLTGGAFMLVKAPIFCVALLGLGNAFFHVGAGRDVLLSGRGRFSALGIFVSPGAAGLFAGTLLGKAQTAFPVFYQRLAVALVLLLTASLLVRLRDAETNHGDVTDAAPGGWAFAATACLFIVVCLRSFAGMAMSFPWKTTVWYALASVLALASGKALGGLLADRFGAIRVSLLSLGLCAVLAIFWKSPACGLASVLLFNMTMPISLGAVYRQLPHSPGAGFGLLTFALFLGVLPSILGLSSEGFMPWGFAGAAVLSAGLLWLGLREKRHE